MSSDSAHKKYCIAFNGYANCPSNPLAALLESVLLRNVTHAHKVHKLQRYRRFPYIEQNISSIGVGDPVPPAPGAPGSDGRNTVQKQA